MVMAVTPRQPYKDGPPHVKVAGAGQFDQKGTRGSYQSRGRFRHAMLRSLLQLLEKIILWALAACLYAGIFGLLAFIVLDFAEALLGIDLVPEIKRQLGIGATIALLIALVAFLWFERSADRPDDL
jgi:hypothetical protein